MSRGMSTEYTVLSTVACLLSPFPCLVPDL